MSTYLIVTSGILAEQHTLQERGIHNTEFFRGIITFAGRHNDADSVVNTANAKDKVSRSLSAFSLWTLLRASLISLCLLGASASEEF